MTIAASRSITPPPRPSGRLGAVRAAHIHSRLVRVLRVALPGLAVLMVAGFVGIILTDPRNALSSNENAGVLGVQRGTITMEAPHLTGFNANGQTYEVIANRAEQSTRDPGLVDLNQLNAKVQMRSEGFARFSAETGHFNSAKQILDLSRKVKVVTDKGDDAALKDAHIDLKTGGVTTDRPVTIKLGTTTLSADSMTLSNNGNHVIFTGKVVMILPPSAAKDAAQPGDRR